MSTANEYPHVRLDADGAARIDETRYKVLHLAAEHYYHGWTAEELLRQHPDLRPAQVYSALAYFYDHHAELLVQKTTCCYNAQPSSTVLSPSLRRGEGSGMRGPGIRGHRLEACASAPVNVCDQKGESPLTNLIWVR
ncbi:MAG: DUF433 domain-containing protein [Pirellulales bacterium]